MPETLKDLRRRIKSVKNTEQITQAMRLVSTAKFGRAQQTAILAKPYVKSLQQVLESTLAACQGTSVSHPLLQESSSKKAVLLVVSSERGLCGSYNANVVRMALQAIADLERQGFEVSITCIGRKAFQVLQRRFRERNMLQSTITNETLSTNPECLLDPSRIRLVGASMEKSIHSLARVLTQAVTAVFSRGQVGNVSIVHTKFESVGSLPLAVSPILPMGEVSLDAGVLAFEPDLPGVVDYVVPRFLETRIRQAFFESVAAEYGARMAAMESATSNAKAMLRKLEIRYQRARQAVITTELIEIVSGAEAL